jgi:hypothetical protein
LLDAPPPTPDNPVQHDLRDVLRPRSYRALCLHQEVDRRVGPEQGRLILHASREGFAAQAGHDLTIEMTRWSGRLRAGVNPAASELTGTVDIGSMRIADGTGGIKPLSELDKREILQNARICSKSHACDHAPL